MTAYARSTLLALAVLALALGAASSAAAFTVGAGFLDPCHERITLAAYQQARAPIPDLHNVPLPGGPWEEVADSLLAGTGVEPSSRQEKFLLFSLLAGVRAPDSEGFSVHNLTVLRAVQSNPAGQYDHCLRAAGDDYLQGNVNTLRGCREAVVSHVTKAQDLLQKASDAQVVKVNFTLDFYGTFEVEVWGVAYHVGRSVHALQDSFTHTLRTADMRQVIHFMNYVEALEDELHEERDGIAHSRATDVCYLTALNARHPGNRDRVFAAIDSSADLFRAVAPVLATETYGEDPVRVVLDKWLTYADGAELGYDEGCVKDNDYCDSAWLALAREDPSGPVLRCSVAAPGRTPHGRSGAGWAGVGCGSVALWLRRRRR
jgi:hypothetical protein